MRLTSSSLRPERGFSLIEQLIAIVVLGLGLLAILAVVINGLKLSASSNYRTIAAQQAYSMADAVRANPFLIGSIAGDSTFSSPTDSTITANCLKSAGCAVSDYVNTVYGAWQEQLATILPRGAGTICRDSTPATGGDSPAHWNCDGAGSLVVKVCWDESRIAASGSTAAAAGLLCTWTTL